MASLARTIRREIARRTGVNQPPKEHGQLIEGTVKGRAAGRRVFDFQNLINLRRTGLLRRPIGKVMVHFRHPTKKRTPGRTCSAQFIQPQSLLVSRGMIANG